MNAIVKNKKIREKTGDIFRIPLDQNLYGYGQVVSKIEYAFFDYFNDGTLPDLTEIVSSKILFRISVDKYVLQYGTWPIIGRYCVADCMKNSLPMFTHDYEKNEYTIWTSEGKRPATPEEVQDIECLASWGHNHVEQRLRDHIAGRPNHIVEYFRNLHNPTFERDIVKFYKQYGYDFQFDDEESNNEK